MHNTDWGYQYRLLIGKGGSRRTRSDVLLMYVAEEVSLHSEGGVVAFENHLKNVALVGITGNLVHSVT
jgi:hypothetical protein